MRHQSKRFTALKGLLCAGIVLSSASAFGLSDITPSDQPIIVEDEPTAAQNELPSPDNTAPVVERAPLEPILGSETDLSPVPLPDPIPSIPRIMTEQGNPSSTGNSVTQDILPIDAVLPETVARMKQLIEDAARTGDTEKLRPLLGFGSDITQLSVAGYDGDPIEHLRALSGDDEGQEILAILLDILSLPASRFSSSTSEPLYVWPYFVSRNLETLTPPERVELFTILTAGDLENMKSFGAYNFFRIGITEAGEWAFFLSGD